MLNKRWQAGQTWFVLAADKLLGGPQAGIIAGKKQLIEKLRKEPMLRALRVCKTTLALLETACTYYLNEDELKRKNLIFKAFHREKAEIHAAAESLQTILTRHGIDSEIVPSTGQCGGGSLPDAGIESYAVMIRFGKSNKESSATLKKCICNSLPMKNLYLESSGKEKFCLICSLLIRLKSR
jgi:L-seryl-tRNA(Ser) seleniumtransferase